MRWQGIWAVAVLLAGCHAAIASPLSLYVEADGTTFLWNTTDAELVFDGYQIEAPDGTLDPESWSGISEQTLTKTWAVLGYLGVSALAFTADTPSTSSISETSLSGAGTLQPGFKYDIGKPFAVLPPSNQAVAQWHGLQGAGRPMDIVVAPEPSAGMLAVLAVVCSTVCARRVRGSRRF